MAKVFEREKAIYLRQNGKSIKTIAKILSVSKGTVSVWCKDVKLTQKQINRLRESMVKGSYAGRMAGATIQHERRIGREKEGELIGINKIGNLSQRDLLIAITALYWGEGSKKNREFFLSNSDPEMIRFLIRALRVLWGIKKDRIGLTVGLNKIHKKRDDDVKDYWAAVTGISKDKFRKTIFIRAKNKKNYKNFLTHYGTLRVRISKSSEIYYQMMGLIHGLGKGF